MAEQAIGFLLHPGEAAIAAPAMARARQRGFEVWSSVDDAESAIALHGPSTIALVTVGGDGTFLYGARLAAPHGIPVLGVNRGRLGFLSDVEVPRLVETIDLVADGRCERQSRAMLKIAVGASTATPAFGLNELTIRSRGVSVARIRINVDGDLLGEFDSDGVVVATPTGSTAYALSAGGPPIDPRVRALLVVPLAPHAVMARAVVLPDTVVVELQVERGRVQAAVDGRADAPLTDGATVMVTAGPWLQVLRPPGSPSFFKRLQTKVHFGVPLKPVDRSWIDP